MIHVEHLTKYFGPVLAVHNVTFVVEKNEIVGLLGNNGAGKTTIMRILTTYLPATSGIARVAGFDVMNESMEVRQRIGYLPESIPLYPEMRVEEYLAYRARLEGLARGEVRGAIGEAVERCLLAEVRQQIIGTLSKGYRQRVGLATAILHRPSTLVLDEPTVGLDPVLRRDLWQTFRRVAEGGATLLVSSHVMEEADRCDSSPTWPARRAGRRTRPIGS